MAKDIGTAVREVCLWLPEADEFVSHGAPTFRVRGKSFACYAVNHHGDGRVALLMCAPPGAAAAHVDAEPRHYFIPPYVGPRGWLGVNLDQGIAWKRVALHVREAYTLVAPRRLVATLGETPEFAPPRKRMAPAEIDPLQSPRGRRMLSAVRKVCLAWPDTTEEMQFGHPIWRVGKRLFARAWHRDDRFAVCFWVGVPAQSLLIADPRYGIPPYFGHQGWIALDVTDGINTDELRGLAQQSYEHYAPRRARSAATRRR